MDTAITYVQARQILDSRGNPTLETDVKLADGSTGRASVPSGASTGSHEAYELRDSEDPAYNFHGVTRAVSAVNNIIFPALKDTSGVNQSEVDRLLISLDGTENKHYLGANAILSVSLAVARAGAMYTQLPLFRYLGGLLKNRMPVPMMNVLNGGSHADNHLDVQEFMLVPHGFSRFADALRAGVECFHCLKDILTRRGLSTAVGDEGGFAPKLHHTREALDILMESLVLSGYEVGTQISLALDMAASGLFHQGKYHLDGAILSRTELLEVCQQWVRDYPVISLEDPCAEDDWSGWELITKKMGMCIQIVGDDLFVTNPARISQGITRSCANCVLIKPNQIGTLSESLCAVQLARDAGYKVIISHRSGETTDTFISDLAVAVGAAMIKAGSVSRGERVAKYNRLLRIEEQCSD